MIISLAYQARVGKDTIADHLVKQYSFVKLSWADPLKKACQEIFHLSHEQTYGSLKEVVDERWGVTPRFILQKVGSECLRDGFDKDIWVKSAKFKMQSYPRGVNFVIPDSRYANELGFIKSWGGKVIKVVRNNPDSIQGISGHKSENSLDNYTEWDYIIENNGSFEDLYRKVDNLIKLLK